MPMVGEGHMLSLGVTWVKRCAGLTGTTEGWMPKIHWHPLFEAWFSGWWFGTFFLFHSVGNVIIPTDFHIFQRGRFQPPTSFVWTMNFHLFSMCFLGSFHDFAMTRPGPSCCSGAAGTQCPLDSWAAGRLGLWVMLHKKLIGISIGKWENPRKTLRRP